MPIQKIVVIVLGAMLGLGMNAKAQIAPDTLFYPADSSHFPDSREFKRVEQEPKMINWGDFKLFWPDLCRHCPEENKVIYRFLINEKGKIIAAINMKSSCKEFDIFIRKNSDALIFTPAIHQQEPVFNWVTVPFRWSCLR